MMKATIVSIPCNWELQILILGNQKIQMRMNLQNLDLVMNLSVTWILFVSRYPMPMLGQTVFTIQTTS